MLLLLSAILFVVIFAYFSSFVRRKNRIKKLINKIPGPDGRSIFGFAQEFLNYKQVKIIEGYDYLHNTYGPLIRKWIVHQPLVSVATAEDAEVILTCRTNIDKSTFYKFTAKWLGTGLLTSTGTKWSKRRKLLTPTFHFSILNTFLDPISDSCNSLLKNLKEKENQQEFNIHPLLCRCALDIICETAMGVKVNAQEESSTYVNAVKEMTDVVTRRIMTPRLWIDWIYYFSSLRTRERQLLKTLHGFTSDVIYKRKMERKKLKNPVQNGTPETERNRKNKAFLDLLLDISEESEESFSNADIREEVDTFMFEGHDTMTVAASWAMHLIGSHPDIQEKIFEELDSVFGSSDRPPTIDDIRKLKYLEMVIKETLRLYPSVFFFSRTLSKDITIREFTIPSGTVVQVNVYRIHRDPRHYTNPKAFDPEHFSSENCQKRHPFAFIPFSAGPRNCIGQKFAIMVEKLLLSTLLRRYRVEATQKTEDLIHLPELVLRPGNGIMVKISRR